MFNFVEAFLKSLGFNAQPAADPPTREFAPAPPIKEHASVSDQLTIAREYNSVKDVAQALQNDLQDRGGIPDPVGVITQLKQEVAEMEAIATIVTTEFVVSGTGYVAGPFSRSFGEAEAAKSFARKCTAAAVNASYAATIKVVPYTTRRAV